MGERRTNTDAERLARLLEDERLSEREREAFDEMSRSVILTAKQRSWVDAVYQRLELDADDAQNLWSDGAVPAGRPVDVPDVLRQLPKRPPGRK